jgi:hypothetical protein
VEHGDREARRGVRVEVGGQLPAPHGTAEQRGEPPPGSEHPLAHDPAQPRLAERLGPDLDAEAPLRGLAGLGPAADEGAGQCAQRAQGAVRAARARDRRAFAPMPLAREGLDERLLAREVAVDRPRAEARLAHHVVHRRAVEAVAREAGARRRQDLAPARLPMGVAHARHGVPPRTRARAAR